MEPFDRYIKQLFASRKDDPCLVYSAQYGHRYPNIVIIDTSCGHRLIRSLVVKICLDKSDCLSDDLYDKHTDFFKLSLSMGDTDIIIPNEKLDIVLHETPYPDGSVNKYIRISSDKITLDKEIRFKLKRGGSGERVGYTPLTYKHTMKIFLALKNRIMKVEMLIYLIHQKTFDRVHDPKTQSLFLKPWAFLNKAARSYTGIIKYALVNQDIPVDTVLASIVPFGVILADIVEPDMMNEDIIVAADQTDQIETAGQIKTDQIETAGQIETSNQTAYDLPPFSSILSAPTHIDLTKEDLVKEDMDSMAPIQLGIHKNQDLRIDTYICNLLPFISRNAAPLAINTLKQFNLHEMVSIFGSVNMSRNTITILNSIYFRGTCRYYGELRALVDKIELLNRRGSLLMISRERGRLSPYRLHQIIVDTSESLIRSFVFSNITPGAFKGCETDSLSKVITWSDDFSLGKLLAELVEKRLPPLLI